MKAERESEAVGKVFLAEREKYLPELRATFTPALAGVT
jgi:hypothetical protein